MIAHKVNNGVVTPMDELKVGDRVKWCHTNIEGTIKQIMNEEKFKDNPYWVSWDKGTNDWYNAKQLVKI